MNVLIFLKHLAKVVDTVLEVLSSVSVLAVYVKITRIVFELFFDIFFVKVYDPYPELLIVNNLCANIEYILLELLLEKLLSVNPDP
jgi:hypothetical protein